MPTGQPGNLVSVRAKVESVFGTPVSGASAEVFRIQPGQGLTHSRTLVEDPEVRRDGQRAMARFGSVNVGGSYPATLSVGSFDTFWQALFGSTWAAAAAITVNNGASLTSFEVTDDHTVAFVGSTDLTTLLKVGDVARFTNMSNSANNNINLRIKTVSAAGFTTHGTPLTIQTADTAATLTVAKKLKNFTSAATQTRRSFTIEEYNEIFDDSELFSGCRVVSAHITMGVDGVIRVEFGIIGRNMTIPGSAATPVFTSPTEYVSIGLVAEDAKISVNGSDLAVVTSLDIMIDRGGRPLHCLGNDGLCADVFEGPFKVTGSFTAMRTALTGSNLATYLAETDNVELHVLAVEPESEPKDFISFFLARLKLLGAGTDLGSDGGQIENVPFYAAAKNTATGYDAPCTMTICTSAA